MTQEKKQIFTDEEVIKLNEYQRNGQFHPYTCKNRNDGKHRENEIDLGLLVATNDGWICPDCDYTQKWASLP